MTRDAPLLVIPLYVASVVGGYYATRYLFDGLWLNAFLALVGVQAFSFVLYLRDLRRKAARQTAVSDSDQGQPSDPA